jgi:hypothetical protein
VTTGAFLIILLQGTVSVRVELSLSVKYAVIRTDINTSLKYLTAD